MGTRSIPTWVTIAGAAVCLAAGLWIGRAWQTPRPTRAVAVAEEPAADSREVRLSPEKQSAARIRVEPAELRPMHRAHIVPGRVQYDDTRHIEIRAATDGVLTQVLVKPGDRVERGQVLAILSSPEVGTARADVLQRLADLDLARKSHEWQEQSSENVADLIAAIESRQTMKLLEAEFQDRRLGDFRGLLFSAYSKYLLADKLASKTNSAAESGAVSSRIVSERTSERESAEELLKAACEQSAFDAKRNRETALAAYRDAQRRYDISRHHLNALLGYEQTGMEQIDAAGLSLVELRAPFAGTIEERTYGVSERLPRGDRQFVLADTTRLWIAADLREADWPALALRTGQTLSVESPAMPGKSFEAQVYYVGREVSPETNAVPLVATISNAGEQLRPGLFVRVTIPLESETEVLAVPSSAVMEHDRQRFVFVLEADGHFRRVDVRTGREESDWIEIRSGLEHHAPVVVSGAFALKSELLLEREE